MTRSTRLANRGAYAILARLEQVRSRWLCCASTMSVIAALLGVSAALPAARSVVATRPHGLYARGLRDAADRYGHQERVMGL